MVDVLSGPEWSRIQAEMVVIWVVNLDQQSDSSQSFQRIAFIMDIYLNDPGYE